MLELESNRASLVEPHKHELGRRVTTDVRDDDEIYRRDGKAHGVRVKADLNRGGNELGERVSNEEMRALRVQPHAVCPAWNYTISPRPRSQKNRATYLLLSPRTERDGYLQTWLGP